MSAYQGYKITDFPDLGTLLGGEYFPVVYGTNYKVTLDQIKAYVAASGVTGPGSAVNGNLASFSGTTGKVIQDTGTALSALATNASLKAYPTFRARKSATQSVPNNSATVVTFNTIDWNVGTGYSSGTNRFTPLVAGYYNVQATVSGLPASGTLNALQIEVSKNGATELLGGYVLITGQGGASAAISCMVLLNGSTDYLQIRVYAITSGAANTTVAATTETYFSAALSVPT